MSARETHVTEFGLGSCAALNGDAFEDAGLRVLTVACSGLRVAPHDDVVVAGYTIPTCPRCAVLRDEALEGRLPKMEAKT